MLKLIVLTFICLTLNAGVSAPAAAQQTNFARDSVPTKQNFQASDEERGSPTPEPAPPVNSPPDYADKTNEAAKLCREAKQYSDNNQHEQALRTLESAVSLDPNANSGVVHNQLGLALSRLGNPKAALSEFNRALKYSPNNSAATLNIAECYKQLGQLDQAKVYLKRFVTENPDSPHVAEAKASLDTLRHTKKITGNKESSDYLDSVSKKGLIGWSQTKMPLRVFIEDGRSVFGFQDSFRDLVQKSLWQWAQASDRRIGWRLVINPTDADIVFHWTSDKSDFPHGAEQGIAKLTWLGHCIQHADVKLCTVSVGSDGAKALPENEMEQTCLHEIGHALGLAGHSSNNNDVMFFCVRPYAVTQLTERDKNAIARLYNNDFTESRHNSGGGGLTVGIPGLFGVRF